MAEYIEREALREKFFTDTRFGFYGEFTDGSETAYTSAEVNAIIVNAPAADVVEVRHGEWVHKNNEMYCSVCGDEALMDEVYYESPYCPNCGADMRGDMNG